MGRFFRKWSGICVCALCAMSLQGCDQIKKIKDYLSPNASVQTESKVSFSQQESDTQKPLDVKSIAKPVDEERAPKELAPNSLARVGDWSLTIEDFQKRLDIVKQKVPEFDPTNVDQKKYILSELIQQQLLVQEALEQKFDQAEDVIAAIEDFRNTALVQALGEKLTKGLDVSDQEAEAYYDENPDFFKTPIEWKVREIVVASEEDAKEILVALNQGASFQETAKAQSISKNAATGGDLGFLMAPTGDPALDTNVFPFEKMTQVVSALDKGGISGSFKGPDGYYIVKVEDVRGGEIQKLEEIREDLKQYLLATKQQQILIDTLTAAQEKYGVNINEKLLEE